MRGRDFLKLSALEVKDWIEKEGRQARLENIYAEGKWKGKVMKKPEVRLRRYGDNQVEYWRITVGYVPYKYTSIIASMNYIKGMFEVEEVRKYNGLNLIDSYDRP